MRDPIKPSNFRRRRFDFGPNSIVEVSWHYGRAQWEAMTWDGKHSTNAWGGSPRKSVKNLRLEIAKRDPKFSAVHDRLVGSNFGKVVVPPDYHFPGERLYGGQQRKNSGAKR